MKTKNLNITYAMKDFYAMLRIKKEYQMTWEEFIYFAVEKLRQ